MNEVQLIRDKEVIIQIKNYQKMTNFRNYILRVSDLLLFQIGAVRDYYISTKWLKRRKIVRKRRESLRNSLSILTFPRIG
jgi:hypothetical protein